MQQQGSSGSGRWAWRSTGPTRIRNQMRWCIPGRIRTKQLVQPPNTGFDSFKDRSGRNGTGSLSLVLSTVFTCRTLSQRLSGGQVLRFRVEASRRSGAPEISMRWAGSGLTEAGTGGQKPRQRCQGWSQTGRSGQSLANLGSSRWTELCRVPTTALRTVQQSHLKKWLSALQAWATVERASPSP